MQRKPRTLHPHPEIQVIHYLPSPVYRSLKTWLDRASGCGRFVCYKKIYEELAKCPISLVFPPVCVRAQNVHYENDWVFPNSSSLYKYSQNVVNNVADRSVTHFLAASQNHFLLLFFDLLHPGLIYL